MAFDIVPNRFLLTHPRFWEEDEDWVAPFTSTNGLSIAEDEKNIYVEASVPGVKPEDIEVTFDKGMLWIKAETKQEETKKKYYRKASNSFSYRIAVPGDIDPNTEPDAQVINGVMKVTFAKSPKAQPKKITVKAGK